MSEYQQIANKHFAKLRELREEKSRIEGEIKKTANLIKAVLNMMPDEEQGPYLHELQGYEMQQMRLTDAIRQLLQTAERPMAATRIKQLLEERGYSFSQYTSNPLSTIHTILKRFKPSDIEKVLTSDGTAGYRWKKKANKK